MVVYSKLYSTGRRSVRLATREKMAIQYAVESVNPDDADLSLHGIYSIRNVPGTIYLVRTVPQLCGGIWFHVHIWLHLAVPGI